MPDQISSQSPTGDHDGQRLEPTIEQRIMALEADNRACAEQKKPDDLATAVKMGELALIIINGLLLIATIIIACIYYGQLTEMRKATDAATKASKTAEDTLTEMKTGSGAADTHTLAEQAVTQATQTTNLAAAASTQTTELRDSIKQAARLASATEIANANAMQADRPWLGAVLSIKDFEVGKKMTVDIIFNNSGRRPAYAYSILSHGGVYQQFPDPETQYDYSGSPSTGLIVPGSYQQSETVLDTAFSQEVMDALNRGPTIYFIFGKIEYRDVRTNEKHWTHVCYRYHPEQAKSFLYGFRQCAEYNDTDDKPNDHLPK